MAFTNKQVLLITSTNLACNPRCLKEVMLLLNMQVKVTVVAFNLHNWTTQKELAINKELTAVHFNYLEATRKQFLPWLVGTAMEKVAKLLLPFFSKSIFLSSMAVGKRTWLLLQWCKATSEKPDLIIAHNPAAFYPAYWLAKKRGVPFALDIEDYHPGEGTDNVVKKAVTLLMQRLMPLAAYNSFAAPLIKQYAEDLFNCGKAANNIVVNNSFPANEFDNIVPVNKSPKLQLVWFSQFIDYGRGLEKILPVLDTKSSELQLTLIGNLRQHFFTKELSSRQYITCIDSMPQKQLHLQLAKYDVGLAIEDAGSDVNRDICLTNKIWAYFQTGLYILASDTTAQKQFIRENGGHGVTTSLFEVEFDLHLQELLMSKNEICLLQSTRYNYALKHAWEIESNKVLNLYNKILNN